jgi:hypothetical protein
LTNATDTMSPATKVRKPPGLQETSVVPVPDHLLALVPEEVRQASKRHADALAQLDDRRSAERAAVDVVAQAVEADRIAAHEAVTAGRDAPASKARKAEADLEAARRAMHAARQIATGTQHDLTAALWEHRHGIDKAVEAKLSEAREERGRLLDTVEDGLGEVFDLQLLGRSVRGLLPPTSRVQVFTPLRGRRGRFLSDGQEHALGLLRGDAEG